MIDPSSDGEYRHHPVTRQSLPKGNVISGLTSPGTGDRFSGRTTVTPDMATSWAALHDSSTPRSSPLTSPLTPLRDVSIVELLDQDDRPTFIVDLTDQANFGLGPLYAAFANTALRAEPALFGSLVSTDFSMQAPAASRRDEFIRFKTWVLGSTVQYKDQSSILSPPPPPSSALKSPFVFAGFRWTSSTLRRHYRVVRGSYGGALSNLTPPDSVIQHDAPLLPLPSSNKVAPTPQDKPAPEASVDASPTAPHTDPGMEQLNEEQQASMSLGEAEDYFGPTAMDSLISLDGVAALSADQAHPSFDWTQIAVTDDLPEHIKFARSVDWASTPLGPIELWSMDLRIMANLVMASPNPAALYWGPRFTVLYNKAYVYVAGQRHPSLMGASYAEAWADIWGDMEPIFHSAWNSGQAIRKRDDRIFMSRSENRVEEMFFNWTLVPLVGSDGSVVALYNPLSETTQHVVNQRRMLTMNQLGEKTSKAQTIQSFWKSVQKSLEYNEFDVPFALIYSVESTDNPNPISSRNAGHRQGMTHSSQGPEGAAGTFRPSLPSLAILEGSVGVHADHPAVVAELDLAASHDGFAPFMRQSMATTPTKSATSMAAPTPVVLSAEDGSLPKNLLAGLRSSRGFPDDTHTVVVFPLYHPTAPADGADGAARVAGFIIMGANPRSPFNRDFQLFVHLLARQLTTSLASAVLFEEEILRAQKLARRAVQDQLVLSQQLRMRTKQMKETENKFMRMAEFTPVGMFVANASGEITYCNDMWRDMWQEISQHPDKSYSKADSVDSAGPAGSAGSSSQVGDGTDEAMLWTSWRDNVNEEDLPRTMAMWQRMIKDKTPMACEFRFRRKTTKVVNTKTSETTEMPTWALMRAYPEKDEKTDEIKSIFGCIVDISQQKMAEASESERRKDAVEQKRQQENFIDITSHEMRNPLSAILQSVDEITGSIVAFRASTSLQTDDTGIPATLNDLLESVTEASGTISLCANHQKRIVEDVLTLSKLDSKLLQVRPISVQPVAEMRKTLKIFETEFYAHGIQCTLRVQPSYQKFVGIDGRVKLDPSRLCQIIINLMTNAVKFTQSSEKRCIVLSLGASMESDPATPSDTLDVVENVDGFDVLADDTLNYVPRDRNDEEPLNEGQEWGTGAGLKLHIAVADTGQGLDEEEKEKLFQRQTHTLPRTHVQYGGPGLGLFISRNLAELQGGQIGVTSRKGHGSAFVFYVRCRKASDDEEEQQTSPSSPVTEQQPTLTRSGSLIVYSTSSKRGNAADGRAGKDGSQPGTAKKGKRSSSSWAASRRAHRREGSQSQLRAEESRQQGERQPRSGDTVGASRNASLPRRERPRLTLSSRSLSRAQNKNDSRRDNRQSTLHMHAGSAASANDSADSTDCADCADSTNSNASGAESVAKAGALRGKSFPAQDLFAAAMISPSTKIPQLDVLIVEDNIVNQRVLQRQLDKCGSRTHVANHGKEALDALRKSQYWRSNDVEAKGKATSSTALSKEPDCKGSTVATNDSLSAPGEDKNNISIILMDLEMPVMDGMTCARAIQDLERTGMLVRHVPIIAVTAYSRPEQIESAKAAGIDDIISKPFRLAQLMPKIVELVKKFQTV